MPGRSAGIALEIAPLERPKNSESKYISEKFPTSNIKKNRYNFDVEIQALSIYDVFRTIPALLPSIQTDLVTKGVSKLKHFDEIRWTGYMGSDSRGAHKIDPHTRYRE